MGKTKGSFLQGNPTHVTQWLSWMATLQLWLLMAHRKRSFREGFSLWSNYSRSVWYFLFAGFIELKFEEGMGVSLFLLTLNTTAVDERELTFKDRATFLFNSLFDFFFTGEIMGKGGFLKIEAMRSSPDISFQPSHHPGCPLSHGLSLGVLWFLFCMPGWPWICDLLTAASECWDYQCVPLCLTLHVTASNWLT